ncbi:hypothetical protein [Mesorhizobium temperatum]|uniref:Uncharacterized protein n=1 Tax=Mesorhizobium temperatum TaxID=241416 RepID=A0A271LYY3_9HYPH|nr:hypothetical protein [Mesorhizobium temperatum]PAQ12388.1 hypothetical protein CIT26_00865 [Mesorhizobium temperatum]
MDPWMFTSNIGRLRFFFYSAALLVAEVVVIVLCIAWTIGFEGLANSKPGPSREGLAAAVLVASLVIVLFRANFARRRSRDALGSKWILWSYIVFSTLFAILQAGTVLVVKFDGEDSHPGLNLLGLALVGLWAVILVAKPAGGSSADMASSLSFDDLDPPRPLRGGRAPHSESAAGVTAQAPAYAMRAAPAPSNHPASQPASLPNGRPRSGGFGRRGLV